MKGNNTIRIAIADDNKQFNQEIQRIISETMKNLRLQYHISSFPNGARVINEIEDEKQYDIYFLRIDMPYRSGFEVAEKIRIIDEKVYIVFITKNLKHMKKSFEFHPYHYLLEEECSIKIPKVLEKITIDMCYNPDLYVIQNGNKLIRFSRHDINYIEKHDKNACFMCNEDKVYRERCSLKEVYERLPHDQFAFINKSIIVNVDQICSITNHNLTLRNSNEILPFAQKHLDEVNEKIRLRMREYTEDRR